VAIAAAFAKVGDAMPVKLATASCAAGVFPPAQAVKAKPDKPPASGNSGIAENTFKRLRRFVVLKFSNMFDSYLKNVAARRINKSSVTANLMRQHEGEVNNDFSFYGFLYFHTTFIN
jgi:hypothetical protein